MKKSNRKKNIIFIILDEEEVIEEKIECSCCFETYNINQFIECNKRHFVCSKCVKTYAESQLFASFNCDITCINSKEKCNALYSVEMLSKILSQNCLDKYNELKTEKEYKMINKCSDEKAHPTSKCNKLSCKTTISEKLSEALILRCNNCNISIVKDHGCNKIVCVCGNKMCNLCKKDVNDVGYRHFCNDNNCNRKCNKCHTFDEIVEIPGPNMPNIVDMRRNQANAILARAPIGLKIFARSRSGRVVTHTL